MNGYMNISVSNDDVSIRCQMTNVNLISKARILYSFTKAMEMSKEQVIASLAVFPLIEEDSERTLVDLTQLGENAEVDPQEEDDDEE